ncbi:UbiA family prenyltransferase [Neolewinella antarctica]|uniref:4-hydroxybenzoate polyprenyltransferase n=1 Tax=Neolewinella antarctica TaxID=442734 RepID=A0ABX0XBL9_9BACT|nr:UbiA family prenyltransferase [Neolewinella antarctica]NJC26465.1 4-hydroxybenzoate polyprenyltransferase [Neolewinella antarctica]
MTLFRYIPLLFRLLRVPNLLVVALTQYLVCYHIIQPALLAAGITPDLHITKFFELTLATVIITASGYVINDIQDQFIDDINRPDTNPVQELGVGLVQWIYGALILGGFLVSQLLAFRLGERDLLWIYPVAVGILAIYSVYFKMQPLLGNLLVGLYCAGVPGIILLAERVPLRELSRVNSAVFWESLSVCFLFMVFAFLATLLRELVKDLEDYKGDVAVGRKTIPVLWGVASGRKIAVMLGILVTLAILLPAMLGWAAFLRPALLVSVGVLALALMVIVYQVLRARNPTDYHRISTQLKLLLLGGLMLLIFF